MNIRFSCHSCDLTITFGGISFGFTRGADKPAGRGRLRIGETPGAINDGAIKLSLEVPIVATPEVPSKEERLPKSATIPNKGKVATGAADGSNFDSRAHSLSVARSAIAIKSPLALVCLEIELIDVTIK